MEKYINKFYLGVVLSACLGIVLGAIAGRLLSKAFQEEIYVPNNTIARDFPTNLSPGTNINKREKLLVIEQADFTDAKGTYPTLVKVKEDLTIKDEAQQTQYKVDANSYFRVVARENGHYTIEARTNKDTTVRLPLEEQAVQPLEVGTWKKVRDSQNNQAWVRVK